ncbi:YoaK family protein [Hydrotalea sp.]|uniref:YoaK family protein n=1 Tax=Hydrotalea sp. TaxID=2881279 RepID=UPI003D099433
MFRHIGDNRNYQHNLRIASLLSFVAGIVNVVGFLSVQRLTTNVTGHFAFFIDDVFKLNVWHGLIFLLYIVFFLLGSFISSFLAETIFRWNKAYVYIIPALIESALLFFVAFLGKLIPTEPDTLAFLLLFTMGLQNSLVTNISKATVRTTHLTGLFTDLGIELSQLFFYHQPEQKKKLRASIRLRFRIIIFFFIGGTGAGLLYSLLKLKVLLLAGSVLVIGATLDYWKYGIIKAKRKYMRR